MLKSTPIGSLAAALLLAGALLLNSGCEVISSGAVVGTRAVNKTFTNQGDLTATLCGDYDSIVRQTHGAIGLLSLNIPDEQNQEPIDTFNTSDANGNPIRIVITRIDKGTCQVSIHYGDHGSEYYSRNVLAAIQKSA